MNKQKKKSQSAWSDSFIENLKGIGGGIADSAINDFGKGVASGVGKGFIDPFFGGGRGGEALDREWNPTEVDRKERYRPKQTYEEKYRQEITLFREQDREVVRQIEMIRGDLQKLMSELGEFGSQVQEAQKAVATEVVSPGKYHVSFFERLRRIISLFRKQIAESRTWLTMSQGKKKQRGYWKMYKKHGTTFGLSQERVLATQAG